MSGSGSSSPPNGGHVTGQSPDRPDPSGESGRLLIVAMDLLRAEVAKSTQAVIENAKAYSVPTPASSPTPQPTPTVPAPPQPVDLMGEPPLSADEAPPKPQPQPVGAMGEPPLKPGYIPAYGFPNGVPGPTPIPNQPVPPPNQKPAQPPSAPTPPAPPGVPPMPPAAPGAPDPNDAGNRILEMILAELKAKSDLSKASKDKLASDKKAKEERAAAMLTPQGIKDQQRAEREKANQGAYQRRVQAGQGLGDYDEKQNYSRRRNDPRYGRDQNRQFNDSAQARASRGAGGGAGTAATRTATAALSAFTGMILRAIGPIGIVIGMLTAVSSGFAQFQQTIDLLVTALGAWMLPMFIILGAAVMSLTQLFFGRLKPMMELFFEGIFRLVVVFDFLIKAVTIIYDLYLKMINAVVSFINKIASFVPGIGEVIADKLPGGKEVREGVEDQYKSFKDGAGDFFNRFREKVGLEKDDGTGDFRKNLLDVMKSFEMSIGPKATLTGLDTSWNKKLLDAINKDPIEAAKQKMLMEIIELMKRSLAKAEGQQAAAPVRGVDGNAQARGIAPPMQGQQGIS